MWSCFPHCVSACCEAFDSPVTSCPQIANQSLHFTVNPCVLGEILNPISWHGHVYYAPGSLWKITKLALHISASIVSDGEWSCHNLS